MNFGEIKKLVKAEYDTRNLAGSHRYKAVDKFEEVLKNKVPELWDDVSKFPSDKEKMKRAYERLLNKETLNGAETSMINEVYNQLNNSKIILTEY